jgi:hypothetical protein
MNYKKVENIRFSLMKKEKDIDPTKAEFITYAASSFKVPKAETTEEVFGQFVEWMYNELLKKNDVKEKDAVMADSLGVWIEYDGKKYENAIALNTLKDIREYGDKDLLPVWEFFKMSLP